jgi:hypothetical protein
LPRTRTKRTLTVLLVIVAGAICGTFVGQIIIFALHK